MRLIERTSWILGLVVVAAIITSKADELSHSRILIVTTAGVVWVLIHLATFVFGLNWPDQLHDAAEQRLESNVRRAPNFIERRWRHYNTVATAWRCAHYIMGFLSAALSVFLAATAKTKIV